MRKIIAVLLVVLMLASALAMLPASAATYDGTTAETAGLNQLIITEVAQLVHERDGLKQYTTTDKINERAKFPISSSYIEIFNNTAATVDFSALSLLRGVNMAKNPGKGKEYADIWDSWSMQKKFVQKMDIRLGAILPDVAASGTQTTVKSAYATTIFKAGDDVTTYIYPMLENTAEDLNVAGGKAAVIWFINESAVKWIYNEWDKDTTKDDFDPREVFIRRHLGAEAAENYDDYNVIMVWAENNKQPKNPTKLAQDMFTWETVAANETNKSIIYALADNTWSLTNDNCKGAVNAKIKSIVSVGNLVSSYGAADNNTAAVFVPSNTTPYLLNKKNESSPVAIAPAVDYVAEGYAPSYAEVAAVLWGTDKSPCSLPEWQQAMMYEVLTTKPAGLTGADDTATAAKIAAALDVLYEQEGIGQLEAGHDEEQVKPNYKDRAELEDTYLGGDDKEDEKDFPWVLVIAIGGGVLLLAAAAVVVFVVVLPKAKKKKAAAEVAPAEEDVAAPEAEEAPVADEALEEAPAEEEAPTEEPTEE